MVINELLVFYILIDGSHNHISVEANWCESIYLCYAPTIQIIRFVCYQWYLPAAKTLNPFWHWNTLIALTPRNDERLNIKTCNELRARLNTKTKTLRLKLTTLRWFVMNFQVHVFFYKKLRI